MVRNKERNPQNRISEPHTLSFHPDVWRKIRLMSVYFKTPTNSKMLSQLVEEKFDKVKGDIHVNK